MGYNSSDDDYKYCGNAGGEKKHILTDKEMPKHTHKTKDYYFTEKNADLSTHTGVDSMNKKVWGDGKSDNDNSFMYYYTHETESEGAGESHENRPPYYTLAYIMKVR